ncbi:RWD domain-containing protein 1 isoform X2 [Histomonas meleagridis]|uniref:RWD domain-containing protein 1 isoform X2 n=1 Tax=Histomonas meleagridis TaxID=135588 RepID=UPI00355A84B9|nr:RWD domain-containing protein 1 isoform X2 [Histomonas meleagridis]KAH0797772.1 RWD domain-containing protein 1 isoform X2 [Histomonas meleagridis]
MNSFEIEKEELSLIYENNYICKSQNVVVIKPSIGMKHATLTFTVPENYPNEVPSIHAELEGISGEGLEKFLNSAAQTMIGLSMIGYLVGEAMDYLSGISDKEIVEQQEHVTATPFSREAFLLWLEKFKKEQMELEGNTEKPMTGRQYFEQLQKAK